MTQRLEGMPVAEALDGGSRAAILAVPPGTRRSRVDGRGAGVPGYGAPSGAAAGGVGEAPLGRAGADDRRFATPLTRIVGGVEVTSSDAVDVDADNVRAAFGQVFGHWIKP